MTPELIAGKSGSLALLTLNRPEALNALSLDMIRGMAVLLTQWAADDTVRAVFITGAGERAFCAGGDIKAAHALGLRYKKGEVDEALISQYFAEEYALNRQLFHYPKPLIAYMDGITMGGGFGVAGPCRYRIVTERTRFAMPEVGIGLFPDVGSVWFLNRCPGQIGAWLAVTGNTIGPADMMYAGLGTHILPAGAAAAIGDRLAEGGDIADTLDSMKADLPDRQADLETHRTLIDSCFRYDTVEDIVEALRDEGSAWARECARVIGTRSPLSLKVSLAHLRRAKGQDFDEVTDRDLTLAHNFMKGHDFFEGVRALVIDKDRQPRWDPPVLAAVSTAMVEDNFVKSIVNNSGR